MPFVPELLDRPRQHVGAVVLRHDAEREVDDADVVAVAIVVAADPVQRREHAGEIGAAVGTGDLEAHHARRRCDAREARGRVAPGDQAREVRAMAERVEVAQVAVAALGREVRAVDQAARLGQATDRDDARVDQRDVDAAAVGCGEPGDAAAAGNELHRLAHLAVRPSRGREQQRDERNTEDGRQAHRPRPASSVPADPVANRQSVPFIEMKWVSAAGESGSAGHTSTDATKGIWAYG